MIYEKVITMICCLICMMLYTTIAYAEEEIVVQLEELGMESADYEEIKDLQEEILDTLNAHLSVLEYDKLSDDYVLPLEKAQKVYIDTGLFTMETADRKAVEQQLQNSEYVWLLTLEIYDQVFQVHISRNGSLDVSIAEELELTDEDIQRIQANEGKWGLAAVTRMSENFEGDFEGVINRTLNAVEYDAKGAKVVLCGGLQHIFYPAAIVMNQEKAELLIPLATLRIDGSSEQIAEVKPEKASASDEVYLYEEIKAAVQNMNQDMEQVDEEERKAIGPDTCIRLSSATEESGVKGIKTDKTAKTAKSTFPVYILYTAVCVLGITAAGGYCLQKRRIK